MSPKAAAEWVTAAWNRVRKEATILSHGLRCCLHWFRYRGRAALFAATGVRVGGRGHDISEVSRVRVAAGVLDPFAGRAGLGASKLHQQIMNLPHDAEGRLQQYTPVELFAYRLAAAELVRAVLAGEPAVAADEGRKVTATEDRWLRNAVKASGTLVAPGRLAAASGAALAPDVRPINDNDALLIDNLVRAALSGDSLAIDTARMALRQRMNEQPNAQGDPS